MNISNKTKMMLKNPVKRKIWVLYQVKLSGTSLAAVAATHGFTRQAAYAAFRRPYPKMEKIIADLLETTPQLLFPERYTSDGIPNKKRERPRKNQSKKVDLNRDLGGCKVGSEKVAANF